MKITIFFLIILCNAQVLSGQNQYSTNSKKAIKHYGEGLRNYRLFYFDIAEEEFLKAIRADDEFVEAYMVMAQMFVDKGELERAVEFYTRGYNVNPEFYTIGYLYKGEIELTLGRYNDALKSFQSILKYEHSNTKLIKRGKRGIKQAKFCIEAVKNPVDFHPVRLSDSVNTRDDEYWPSLSADEQTLVITRLVGSAEGKFIQEDFYMSEMVDSQWSNAKNVGRPLNTSDNEGAQSISANGKVMVYTVCNRKGIFGKCDIYYSEKKGDLWSDPVNMGPNINSSAKETQPSLSSDARILYFVSDRAGGKGGLDIWVSKYQPDGSWSKPGNLGDSINTPGDESSPFIHPDNKTLYFSSNYHLGMGGFDIFYSRLDSSGNWSEAKNIGYPINTQNNEIGLIINSLGNRAYYSAELDSAFGKDIYCFNIPDEIKPDEVSYMKGTVYDKTNHRRLKANFELYDLSDGKLISKSTSDPYNGKFLVTLPTNNDYMLNVSKEGYLFYSENFSLEGVYHVEEPFVKDVPMNPIRSGKSIILNNIFYDTDSYKLKPHSRYELDRLVSFLNNNPVIKVEISGHTDNTGTEKYNIELSEKRAKSVIDYLIRNGIKSERLVAKGYGFSKPIDINDTEEGRANNRRTELMILSSE